MWLIQTLIFFYLFIYLFIDEEDGNGLAVGCTAFKRHFADSLSLFEGESCHSLKGNGTLPAPKGARFDLRNSHEACHSAHEQDTPTLNPICSPTVILQTNN